MQGKNFQEMGQISSKVTRAQYLGDIGAAADYAKQQSWARADRPGVTGFCGGGALALHTAAEYPGATAAVPWYGHVKRTYPDAPGVDAFSGEPDQGAGARTLRWGRHRHRPGGREALRGGARKTNPSVEFILYPAAPHAFFSDRPASEGLRPPGLRGVLH